MKWNSPALETGRRGPTCLPWFWYVLQIACRAHSVK
eukprot:COSAG02_NODE_34714_length_479_cov_1.623684_1_plen_35_part_10